MNRLLQALAWAGSLGAVAAPAEARTGLANVTEGSIVVALLADASSSRMRIGLTLIPSGPAEASVPEPASLGYPASPNAVLCRSDDQGNRGDRADRGYRECRTPFKGPVTLSREVGATHCIEDHNWGWREGAVWVDRGCGAVFVRVSAK